MQALILCGGLGTRLRGVLGDGPKAMAPVRGTPFLRLLMEHLKSKGVADFVWATGYRSDAIEEYFRDGGKWGVSIRYSRENSPMGTGGAVKLAESLLDDRFLVLNGDTFAEFEPADLESTMEARNGVMVLSLKSVPDASRYGRVKTDDAGRVQGFSEKGGDAGPGLINAGVYLMRKEILSDIAPGAPVSLETEVIPRLLAQGVYGREAGGLFIDIGVPEDYRLAQTLLPGVTHAP